ncbi:SDR family oxidoreductase [Aeromicrobium sp. Root472D3]|uniref:SDR family oxidoreductase n=1 Tax=Aeromicrobium sp. Root472D3 TaxID=1736540 RepID=UPI0006F7DD21|nr:NmrA family NAD(P)-binding protein [Aeromicrobium sp. Root472D3]KQX76197.1 hydroxylase [Aeromicrobium sp. Root472D3]
MTYLVHGATGAQGSPVLSFLRAAGHSATAAVRDTSSTDGPAVSVDVASVDSLTSAYRGATGVFVHLPVGSAEQQLAAGQNIGTAVVSAEVPRVVVSTSGYPLEPGSGLAALVDALTADDVSFAVVQPRLFLENLLLPPVTEAVQAEGVLRYPVRADYPLSWASHLDVADAVVALLLDRTITGRIGVGALPPLVGADLAAGFAEHHGTDIAFEPQDPEDFGRDIIPMFGEAGARPVIDSYAWRQTQPSDVIDAATSAQRLLGLSPRGVAAWLDEIGA